MSDAVIIAAIGGLVGIISKAGLVIGNLIKAKVDTIHKQINSRMDELLKITRESSEAKGVLKEKKDQENKTSL